MYADSCSDRPFFGHLSEPRSRLGPATLSIAVPKQAPRTRVAVLSNTTLDRLLQGDSPLGAYLFEANSRIAAESSLNTVSRLARAACSSWAAGICGDWKSP